MLRCLSSVAAVTNSKNIFEFFAYGSIIYYYIHTLNVETTCTIRFFMPDKL